MLLGFRFWTDGATQGNGGPLPPGISVGLHRHHRPAARRRGDGHGPVDVRGAVAGTSRAGVDTTAYHNAYIVENRQYIGSDRLHVGFDQYLLPSPYNFVFGRWTERFPYQNGIRHLVLEHAVRQQQRGRPPG